MADVQGAKRRKLRQAIGPGKHRDSRSASLVDHGERERKPAHAARYTQHSVRRPGSSNEARKIIWLAKSLLEWFSANARDLPWRRTRDPYAIWVSEIMLQQTQVKTVIPYWEHWMRQLPDLNALSRASSQRLHKLWEGLGYYTRVRNMQRAARLICRQHHGRFPARFEDVLALPGVGRYTAGAVCSIAFNQPAPVLDGNVMRVLTRLFGIKTDPREAKTNARLWQLATALVTQASAFSLPSAIRHPQLRRSFCSHLNQSLMELGATTCAPRNPLCSACPIHRQCIAQREDLTERIPQRAKRPQTEARKLTIVVAQHSGRFWAIRRAKDTHNGGLWEFPPMDEAESLINAKSRPASKRHRKLPPHLKPLGTIKHTITRYKITLEVFRNDVTQAHSPASANGRWLTPREIERLPFSAAHRKIAALLGDGQQVGETQRH